jgi:hypothetical protein
MSLAELAHEKVSHGYSAARRSAGFRRLALLTSGSTTTCGTRHLLDRRAGRCRQLSGRLAGLLHSASFGVVDALRLSVSPTTQGHASNPWCCGMLRKKLKSNLLLLHSLTNLQLRTRSSTIDKSPWFASTQEHGTSSRPLRNHLPNPGRQDHTRNLPARHFLPVQFPSF